MGLKNNQLLNELNYNQSTKTALFSPDINYLQKAKGALRNALGIHPELNLKEIELKEDTRSQLFIEAKTNIFEAERKIGIFVRNTDQQKLDYLLILVPFPETGWALHDGFQVFKNLSAEVKSYTDLTLKNGCAVISYGIYDWNDEDIYSSSTGDIGKLNVGGTEISFIGYGLEDGLQIFGDYHAAGADSNLLQGFRHMATHDDGKAVEKPIIGKDVLAANNPSEVEIVFNQLTGWIDFEYWWEMTTPPKGFKTRDVGYMMGADLRMNIYKGDEGGTEYSNWMFRINPEGTPRLITLVYPEDSDSGFTPRYHLKTGHTIRIENGNGLNEALMNGKAYQVFNQLSLDFFFANCTVTAIAYEPFNWLSYSLSLIPNDGNEEEVVVGPFTLRKIDLNVDISYKEKSHLSLGISALTDFLGQVWKVHYRPKKLLKGALATPGGVKVGHLIDQIIPSGLPIHFDNFFITRAELSRSLRDASGTGGETAFNILLEGRVGLFSDALFLSELELSLKKPDSGASSGFIRGLLEMGPVALGFSAMRIGKSWILSAEAQIKEGGLNLTDLVDHLVKTLGVAVPEEIPDLELKSIGIQFDFSTYSLSINCITAWKVDFEDVPVLNGNHAAILNLQITGAKGQGRSASFMLNWNWEKPLSSNPELIYNVAGGTLLSKESKTFSFDVSAPDWTKPLKLSDLASDLNIPDLPLPVAGVTDTIFQVSQFSMNFTRPGNGFSVAWSRPFGAGLLVAEYEHGIRVLHPYRKKNPKMPARDRGVNVRWLGQNETDTIGLTDVVLLIGGGTVPTEFDNYFPTAAKEMLTFKELGFRYSKSNAASNVTFKAISTYRDGTEAFVTIQRGGQRGVVAGFIFGGKESSSQSISDALPFDNNTVLKSILDTVDAVLDHVELTHVIVSTVKSKKFRTPAFTDSTSQTPTVQGSTTGVSRPFGMEDISIDQGVGVGFKVRFGYHPLLSRFIKIKELYAQATLAKENIGFKIFIPETLSLDVGGGNGLALTQPSLEIKKGGSTALFNLGGNIELMLFGESIEVGGWLSLSTKGIYANLEIKELSLPPIPMIPGVHFEATTDESIYLLLGLNFQPPSINLGVQAPFYICTADPDVRNTGQAGFVLEIVKGAAHPKYLEFGLEKMNLMTAVEVFTGVNYFTQLAKEGSEAVGDALDGPFDDLSGGVEVGAEAVQGALEHIESVVSNVELQSVRFHWANNITYLPDGNIAMPGVGFRAGLEFLGWNAFASLNFSLGGTPGLEGHFETETFEIPGVIRIWGNGKGIKELPKGDAIQNPDTPLDYDDKPYFLEPGGPVLKVSTNSSPFIYADLHAELFGFLETDIHAEVGTNGFDFHFGIGAGEAVRADLGCHWWRDTGKFEAFGSIDVQLKGSLGPIIPGVSLTEFHLDTELNASVRLTADSESFRCAIDGSFEFQGAEIDMPELVLTVKFQSFEDLANVIWEHIKNLAEDIFEEFLLPIGEFIAKTAEEVVKIGKEAAEFAVDVAEEGIKKAGELLEKPVGLITDAADAAATTLVNSAEELSKLAEKTLKEASKLAEDAAKEIVEQAGKVAEAAVELANRVADEIVAIGEDIKQVASQAAKFVGQKAKEAIQYVSRKIEEAKRWAGERLKDAMALANQLYREADAIVNKLNKEIASLVNEIDEFANMIADFLESLVTDTFETAVDFISDPFDDWW